MALLKGGGTVASLGVSGTMSMLKQESPLQSRIAHEMRGMKLGHLRLTMKAADLGLAMVRQPYPYP